MSFNRYGKICKNGKVFKMPNIKINLRDTDYYVNYERGKSRIDLISYEYYGDASYDWLILLANPNVAGLEFNIPDNTVMRVPFPLKLVLEEFNNKIDAYDIIYGID
jgi:hypothetical protein